MKFTLNSKGMSLIEILVSIILIFIILSSFFSLFIQTKKTNVSSETIQTATYVAQQEMEKLHSASKKNIALNAALAVNNYTLPASTTSNYLCVNTTKSNPTDYSLKQVFQKVEVDYQIELTISHLCDYKNIANNNQLMSIVLKVNNQDGSNKAILENILIWE